MRPDLSLNRTRCGKPPLAAGRSLFIVRLTARRVARLEP